MFVFAGVLSQNGVSVARLVRQSGSVKQLGKARAARTRLGAGPGTSCVYYMEVSAALKAYAQLYEQLERNGERRSLVSLPRSY